MKLLRCTAVALAALSLAAACHGALPARPAAVADAGSPRPVDDGGDAGLVDDGGDAGIADDGGNGGPFDPPPSYLPGFVRGPSHEWVRTTTTEDGRVHVDVDGAFDPSQPTLVVVYALPNGNTIEQTLGRRRNEGESFRYDIQHVLAQTRLVRSLVPGKNVVLVCLENDKLSWPTWVRSHEGAARRAREMLLAQASFVASPRWVWASHSGGGSLLLAAIDGGAKIPDEVDTIVFLDSHYAFEEKTGEGKKLAAWLRASTSHRLVALAYDDRNVVLHRRRIVGPKGGSYRATDRMRTALQHEGMRFGHDRVGPFDRYLAEGGRVDLRVHPNKERRILHSALVSDENGLSFALALGHGVAAEQKARFGRPRTFDAFVDPAPPPNDADAGTNEAGTSDAGEPDADLGLP